MRIFVTVGTTSFDSMIENIDQYFNENKKYNVNFQIANGNYTPKSGAFFSFRDDVDVFYNDADVIITHAGAGTLYQLLEKGKKIIAVPNLERIDKHQVDIATYMERNHYLLVCWDYNEIGDLLKSIHNFKPNPYYKIEFDKGKEIADYIRSLYS